MSGEGENKVKQNIEGLTYFECLEERTSLREAHLNHSREVPSGPGPVQKCGSVQENSVTFSSLLQKSTSLNSNGMVLVNFDLKLCFEDTVMQFCKNKKLVEIFFCSPTSVKAIYL